MGDARSLPNNERSWPGATVWIWAPSAGLDDGRVVVEEVNAGVIEAVGLARDDLGRAGGSAIGSDAGDEGEDLVG